MNLSLESRLQLALLLPAAAFLSLFLAACSSEVGAQHPQGSADQTKFRGGPRHSYATDFPAAENPISEAGKWRNGGLVGLDWGDVQTTPGLAFGTTVSPAPPYDDSTAVLTGSWGPNQTAQATVYTVNQTHAFAEEVELRLRTTVTRHSITGYEFVYRATSDGSQYIGIVRWNGPLNDFTYLRSSLCTQGGPGLRNGDTIMATAIGDTLSAYINGVKYCQVRDSTYTGGSPGIGFWNWGGTQGDNKDYGFTRFSAADDGTPTP